MNLMLCRSLSYAYEGNPALVDFDMELGSGEKIALLGSNGSGKSTLLKILAGLVFPKKGSYRFKGKAITKSSINASFRQKVAILFQQPESMLLHTSVFDELAFSPRQFGMDYVEERVHAIAKRFGLEKLLKKNPLQLSGGEKQKVVLAALVIYEPNLLLLDEPTAAMDPRTTGWFIDLLHELSLSAIIATHDLGLAYESADRAVVLDERHRKIYDGEIETLYGDLSLLQQANLIHRHHHHHKNFTHSHYHLHF